MLNQLKQRLKSFFNLFKLYNKNFISLKEDIIKNIKSYSKKKIPEISSSLKVFQNFLFNGLEVLSLKLSIKRNITPKYNMNNYSSIKIILIKRKIEFLVLNLKFKKFIKLSLFFYKFY